MCIFRHQMTREIADVGSCARVFPYPKIVPRRALAQQIFHPLIVNLQIADFCAVAGSWRHPSKQGLADSWYQPLVVLHSEGCGKVYFRSKYNNQIICSSFPYYVYSNVILKVTSFLHYYTSFNPLAYIDITFLSSPRHPLEYFDRSLLSSKTAFSSVDFSYMEASSGLVFVLPCWGLVVVRHCVLICFPEWNIILLKKVIKVLKLDCVFFDNDKWQKRFFLSDKSSLNIVFL